jgi:hypothetical protein
MLGRPSQNEYGSFYSGYISLVPEENCRELLLKSITELEVQLSGIPEERSTFKYGPDKWTIVQLLQHIIDTERIFSYRALCIARGETMLLPGFNEVDYAKAATAEHRTLEEMKNEFIHLRKSVVYMFTGFDEKAFSRMGIASETPVSVRALGYMIVGHSRHHFNILKERYLG